MDEIDFTEALIQAIEAGNFDAACAFVDYGVPLNEEVLDKARKYMPILVDLIERKMLPTDII